MFDVCGIGVPAVAPIVQVVDDDDLDQPNVADVSAPGDAGDEDDNVGFTDNQNDGAVDDDENEPRVPTSYVASKTKTLPRAQPTSSASATPVVEEDIAVAGRRGYFGKYARDALSVLNVYDRQCHADDRRRLAYRHR